jgi:drug/metabolite transporter (DMT)-like permease
MAVDAKAESMNVPLRPGLDISARLSGALFVAASATGFGVLGILGKVAFAAGASTATVLFLRFLVAGAGMALWMTVRRLPWPRGNDLWVLVGMGAIGYVGQAFCYFSALRHASAGLTALLLYLYPALVALASAALGRQRLTWFRSGAVLLSLAGIVLAVSDGLAGSPAGIAFGAGAALIYSAYILTGELVTVRSGAIPAATVIMLSASAVYGAALAIQGPVWPAGTAGWLAIAGIALFSTVIAMVCFFAGMQRLGAADTATLSTLEPVVTLLLAFALLGESLGPRQIAGAALVILAVITLARARNSGRKADS